MSEKVSLQLCDFHKPSRKLTLASEYFAGGFPQEIEIHSHHTGRSVAFRPVQQGDPLWDEDGWDGEQCIYRPIQFVPNVDYLIVHHEW